MAAIDVKSEIRVALLTAGRDTHYAYGVATALIAKGLYLDIIGGDGLESAEWSKESFVRFLNLRGDMREDASLPQKMSRVMVYYVRLMIYAATTKANIFHILWNNKFESFDRVGLMLYYKLLGKKTLLTVHNVNARTRDSNDSWFNRLTLKIQYQLVDHMFVHTERMKRDLIEQFKVAGSSISVIPYGINNAVPDMNLGPEKARGHLGIAVSDKVILFFGNIAPYKGLEYLIDAFGKVMAGDGAYRLIIAGKPKDCESYCNVVLESLKRHVNRERIFLKIEHIPDEQTELYFKAADVLVLPYRYIYQSGVLFLGYNFGLPVIATDVGSLREDIIEGETGFVCRPEDAADLARVIEMYFASDLYRNLNSRREEIQAYVRERHSWDVVGQLTVNEYAKLLGDRLMGEGARIVSR